MLTRYGLISLYILLFCSRPGTPSELETLAPEAWQSHAPPKNCDYYDVHADWLYLQAIVILNGQYQDHGNIAAFHGEKLIGVSERPEKVPNIHTYKDRGHFFFRLQICGVSEIQENEIVFFFAHNFQSPSIRIFPMQHVSSTSTGKFSIDAKNPVLGDFETGLVVLAGGSQNSKMTRTRHNLAPQKYTSKNSNSSSILLFLAICLVFIIFSCRGKVVSLRHTNAHRPKTKVKPKFGIAGKTVFDMVFCFVIINNSA